MAIRIQIEKQKPLEFEILEKTYEVYTDDSTLKKMEQLEKEIEEVKKSEEFEDYRNQLIRNFDVLFGKGIFEEIEGMVDDTGRKHTIIMLNIFLEVAKEVKNKLNELSQPIMDTYKPE